jgi:hypothetical protein
LPGKKILASLLAALTILAAFIALGYPQGSGPSQATKAPGLNAKLVQTSTNFIYVTSQGNYTFPKALPFLCSYKYNSAVMVLNSTFWLMAGASSVLIPYSSSVSASSTIFNVNETIQITTSTVAYLDQKWNFSNSRTMPKISIIASFTSNWKYGAYNITWVVQGYPYVSLVHAQAVPANATQALGLCQSILMGPNAYPLTWNTASLLLSWVDFGNATVVTGKTTTSSKFSVKGIQVRFPTNVSEIDPSLIASSTTAPFGSPPRDTFYALNLHWFFYYNVSSFHYYFKTSSDGSTWSSPTQVTSATWNSTVIGLAQITTWLFYTAGNWYVDLVMVASGFGGFPIYNEWGKLVAGGSITWNTYGAVIAVPAVSGIYYKNPSICVSSDSYTYIGYQRGQTNYNNIRIYATKDSNQAAVNLGWNTASNFPYKLYDLGAGSLNLSSDASVQACPLTSGKVAFAYIDDNDYPRANTWTGSGWSGESKASLLTVQSSFDGNGLSASAIGDTVAVAWDTLVYDNSYILYTYGTGFGSRTQVNTVHTGYGCYPALMVDTSTNNTYVFWIDWTGSSVEVATHLYYKVLYASNSSWSAKKTAYDLNYLTITSASSSYESYSSIIGTACFSSINSGPGYYYWFLNLAPSGHAYATIVTEILQPKDTLNKYAKFTRAETEKISVQDTFKKYAAFVRAETEKIKAYDSFSKYASFIRAESEKLAAYDTFAKAASFARVEAEKIAAHDAFSKYGSFTRKETEKISMLDAFKKYASFVRIETEVLRNYDTFSKYGSFIRMESEKINMYDSFNKYASFARTEIEAFRVRDAFGKHGHFTRTEIEQANIFDSIYHYTAHALVEAESDIINMIDSARLTVILPTYFANRFMLITAISVFACAAGFLFIPPLRRRRRRSEGEENEG